ncbi:hypothetical protein VF14_08955 [Nostoc linckia z18]|uniref:Uncharacterized protein n=2 Tax=Nostoc linckia TaxID=92942 RepID=A0A9Q6EMH9_NOSLI|nr:hypothetical protein [Nostoc linckia]PHK42571.1 hypothetical protein VF12_02600 [Nostoc linckia z15]PHK44547.1 hypothetical protein VF13_21305 [Nostoc linckia z16]PHJ59591.1 hypothetical protein VF02_24580 [Nostoc linckia z1]PHJ65131.1 hypothetical protein VF05_21570 [Nostoc linckia z3]PHJ69596.1 hypothetical protein VF03_23660 [Nostoc linckia z2]
MATIILRPEKSFPPRNGPVCFDSLTLRPGSNLNISDDIVEQLRSHPDFPQYERWGAIEIISPKTEINPNAPQPSELSTMNVEEAEKVIENCADVAKLEAWLASESRVTVRRAINRRIAAIKGGNE